MFRKHPYWGWLTISLILWVVNFVHFNTHRQERLPAQMAKSVNEDLQQKERECDNFLNNETLIRKIYNDSLTESETDKLIHLHILIYAYKSDTLVFWNNNKVICPYADSLKDKYTLVRNEKGIFIEKCVRLSYMGETQKLAILFPVVITYPLENEYLKSHFVASDYIPVKTRLSMERQSENCFPVSLAYKNIVFYLNFNTEDISFWEPDWLFIITFIISVFTSIFWLQRMIVYLAKKGTPLFGFTVTLSIIATIKGGLMVFGLPFNLDTLKFFSSSLFYSGNFVSSLGDLFINILLLLWIFRYVLKHTPYKTYFIKVINKPLRYVISVLLIFTLCVLTLLATKIVENMVISSNISFDVSHFYAIDVNTILGLLAISALTAISCLIIYLCNIQLSNLIGDNGIKYWVLILSCLLFLLISNNIFNILNVSILIWIIIFIVLLDVRNFTLVSDLLEPHMIFWAVIICGYCTMVIHYFNQIKEKTDRKDFVEQRLSPHRDTAMEAVFDKLAQQIMKDKIIRNYFTYPTQSGRKIINQRFETQYLNGMINPYQVKIYLFDERGEDLYNKDTTSFDNLMNEKNESANTKSAYLFYKESILDRHYYLSDIPVYDDSDIVFLGHIMIDLDLKKRITETVYPELLQPPGNRANKTDNEYAYAVYMNDKLITQTNDYPFTVYLNDDTLHEQQYAFYNKDNITELYYKISDKRTAVVVHYHNEILEDITLFSYLFGIQVLMALLILLYRLFYSYFTGNLIKLKFLNLRRRVHFSMLAVILISFAIIGFVTILFLTLEYKENNSKKLQSAMQIVKQSVQENIKRENAFESDYIFDSVCKSTRFKYFIANLSYSQKIDINIFDDQGNLFAASQEEIYEKGLISRKIRPDAFYRLSNEGKSIVIQDEKVAGLAYLSAYQPLRNDDGVTFGYIGIPFFSSEKDLHFQISNIVVTLINLYAFIFLISSVITVIITRWIITTFNIISLHFKRLNLQKNERLIWPYDDEVGKLVVEYNKMAQKVEENALLLAKSERESAWREMARQIAHEIKNPLTPMKLNIQYLHQAIVNNHPNTRQIADRVADSIIEQIDNLSYIASEFSNFAKLPDAKPEEINLIALIKNTVELYKNIDNIQVSIEHNRDAFIIWADKSQLISVFTNLLENAKQAIPKSREGIIEVFISAEDEFAIVKISDNGVGIEEEIGKRIFEPYFTTKNSGTGLGLAMTKKIIELLNGEIWFETEVGKGTTFYVKLKKIV